MKYLVYSHNHSDHVYGAEVFKDSQPIFISSQPAKQDLVITRANTVIPDIIFEERMNVSLGDNEVELRYHVSYIMLLCASRHNNADSKNYGAILRHFIVDATLERPFYLEEKF